MAPPAVHALCDSLSGNATAVSSALVPVIQCSGAYEKVGASVVALSSFFLVIFLYMAWLRLPKASATSRALMALAVTAVSAWLVEGGGLLAFGRLGGAGGFGAAEASAASAADAVGREVTRGCLGILLFVLAARRNFLAIDAAVLVVTLAAPATSATFAVMAARGSLPASAASLFPRASSCVTCVVWDSASALAATLYGLGGVVLALRFSLAARYSCARRADGGIPNVAQPAPPETMKDFIFFAPLLLGYCAADIFSISACSLGCTPYAGIADADRGDSVARLLGVAAELPLLCGLIALAAYTLTQGGEAFDLITYQSSSETKAVNRAWQEDKAPIAAAAKKSTIVMNPVALVAGGAASAGAAATSGADVNVAVPVESAAAATAAGNPFLASLAPPSSAPPDDVPGAADSVASWASR
jgi:hypothetical protein